MATDRTIVFVHGAWGAAHDWDLVRGELSGSAPATVAVDLPTAQRADATLADDIAAVIAAVDGADGPVTLCAHSYGGTVVTDAATSAPAVDRLVYVAAGMPEKGQTMFDILNARPTEDGVELEFRDDGTSMIGVWPREDGAYPPEAVEWMRARPRNWWAVAAAVTPIENEGWRHIDTTYVVAARDTVIHPDTQREMAARADRTIEWDCHHFVQAVHHRDLAALLRDTPA